MGATQKPEQRQMRLLTWILRFVMLSSIVTLLITLVYKPQHDSARSQYALLIVSLVIFFFIAYILNCVGYYNISAILLVVSAVIAPWASLLIDPSILQGDFVPLTYIVFSILLSSILLPMRFTLVLAIIQFVGLTMVLIFSPATATFNWFSFLAFVFLTSVLSILKNNIIQRDMKQIAEQAHQLLLSEALLQEQSIRDYLTNLFNRRYLEETLNREIQRAARKQFPLCVIMLDVDHFKHINDNLGHAAGDTVLREVGKFLAEQIRQSDIACRYGGDEFALILPDTSREVTMERAKQLQAEAKNLNLPVTVTLSLGIAVFPNNGSDGETLLKSADVALYQGKHDGGNSVKVAE